MSEQHDAETIPAVPIAEPTRRTGRWLSAVHLAVGALIVLSIIYYGFGFREYLMYLSTGFTGTECLVCNYRTGDIQLNVIPGGPAARVGISRGDALVEVDEVDSVDGVDSADLNPPVRDYDEPIPYGVPGTTVSLTVRGRSGSVKEYTVIREEAWGDLVTVGPRILGASGPVSIMLALGSDLLILLGFVCTGLFMIWRKPKDWLVMLAGVGLILVGNYATRAPLFLSSALITGLYISVALVTFFSLFFVFPNGKLVPRWAPIVIGAYAVWQLTYMFGVRPVVGTWSAFRVVDIVFWSAAVATQVYRYRKLSSLLERQQTKWVLLGLAVCLAERFVFVILGTTVPALNLSSSTPLSYIYLSLGDTIGRLIYLVIPLTFMIGVLRYRLWDVDFVINRSLAYTLLTAVLGVVFAAGFWGIQALFGLVFSSQQPTLAIVASTILMIGVFNPTQQRLRTFVDRLYGIKVNYQPTSAPHPSPVATSLQLKTDRDIYQGLESIGKGGMAEIYKASDPKLKRMVAIKVLSPVLARDPEFQKRFEREAQIVATLKHPNIVRVHDSGVAHGSTYYMVMEYIDGHDLAHVIRDSAPLPPGRVDAIVQDIASALDYAHAQGLVHRDVKPSNVMLEPVTGRRNKAERAVLMDFGIARLVTAHTRLTASGMVGTLDFISPEQIQDAAIVDGRADIYSLAVMSYQMVTGQLPFKHENAAAVLLAHLMQPAPDPRTIVPGVRPSIAQAIMRAMAKKPDERFATAGEFAAALAK